jgi:hypothetical protein
MTFANCAPMHEPHEFEIGRDACGHWVARGRDGLVGGVFRRREDAIRFALFEADGDSSRIHLVADEVAAPG